MTNMRSALAMQLMKGMGKPIVQKTGTDVSGMLNAAHGQRQSNPFGGDMVSSALAPMLEQQRFEQQQKWAQEALQAGVPYSEYVQRMMQNQPFGPME